MRRVKITKNVVKKGTVFMGFTKKQLIIIIAGGIIAISTLVLLLFVLEWSVDVTMSIVFFEIVLIVGFGVININGVSLFRNILNMLKKPSTRVYSTKGLKDTYEK